HQKPQISLRTVVQWNLKKLREHGTVAHRRGNDRPTKGTQSVAVAIGYVRQNTAISTRQIAIKVQETQDISISYPAVRRHMKKKGISKFCASRNTDANGTIHRDTEIMGTSTY